MKIFKFVLLLLLTTRSFSQHQVDTSKYKTAQDLPNDEMPFQSLRELSTSSYEFGLSTVVLIFGLIVIIIETYLFKAGGFSADQIVRLISITLIIISALFLITSAYSDTQMAPVMGLLGTLSGYLLGRSGNDSKS